MNEWVPQLQVPQLSVMVTVSERLTRIPASGDFYPEQGEQARLYIPPRDVIRPVQVPVTQTIQAANERLRVENGRLRAQNQDILAANERLQVQNQTLWSNNERLQRECLVFAEIIDFTSRAPPDTCPICLEDNCTLMTRFFPCGHKVCRGCVGAFRQRFRQCMTCREEIVLFTDVSLSGN